jgi:PAS domain-containing protein
MLTAHEPYPAVVMDRHWNILDRNQAAQALFGWVLREHAAADDDDPANLIRNFFDPDGLRPYVANWDEAAAALIQCVHREAIGGAPDARTTQLLDDALAYPGVPPAWRRPDLTRPLLPVVPVTFSRDGRTFSYFSAVTKIGTPQDAQLQELRVESLHPADEQTTRTPTP